MNQTASARRQEQPLELGAHGYRIDGDEAVINAEIIVPPYHPGGVWLLQLWASLDPPQGRAPSGTKIGELRFDLPTPLGPHCHRIEARVPALLPPQGRRYAMSLALVDARNGAEPSVRELAHYSELEDFPGPRLTGTVGYAIRGGDVLLQAAHIASPRSADNLSGSLALELWAFGPAASEGEAEAHCLARALLGRMLGQQSIEGFEQRVPFTEPPAGHWQLSLCLREWTRAFGYVTRDRRDFAQLYRRAPDPSSSPVASLAATAPTLPEIAPEPCSSARTPSVQLRAPRLISIQTASVEDLAKLKGLNLRLAKEIVRVRPFASIDELVRVHGIGKKTLERLRPLVTL